MPHATDYVVRDYGSPDEPSWLRCRILSFLATAYFDDVMGAKPVVEAPGFELVAIDADHTVVGLIDVTVDGAVGTIDTLAVHPDHQNRGIARTILAHWCTILVSVILDGLPMHPRRRRVIALLARQP